MALNVNIIGKDSEGNLRALKVNSEGNLDFGQLETEIQVIKDNQGRLYGKYGEAWIPVKVDSEGRPIIASDVTVNAEDMVVDLGQIKQGPAGTEPWLVQLSGTSVTSEVLFPRQVRQQGETNRILRTPPAGAKGFAIKHIIYGVTGNFSSEQGSKLFVETRGVNDASGTFVLFSVPINPTYTLGHHQVVVVYPGIAPDGLVIASGRQFKVISIPASLFSWIFFIQTSGTFTAEQGVDSEVVLQWIA